ncbi:MAG: TetR/AcrR family transcriptional regulator [Paludibacteraceae bacterium]|nr:TetR/AcrR family transcriptional regulator [Paludibacteraceae bacterium]
MENKIIQAAKETFLKKGYKETNMSDIAAAVGLTRPAMHYYFRTKERLFQAVFGEILLSFLPKIKGLINADIPLEEKIGKIVDEYFVILKETPELPLFLMKEASRDFDAFVKVAIGSNIVELGNNVFSALEEEMAAGRIKRVPLIEIFYTFYGLLTVPFMTLPVATQVFGEENITDTINNQWKSHIINYVTLLLKP